MLSCVSLASTTPATTREPTGPNWGTRIWTRRRNTQLVNAILPDHPVSSVEIGKVYGDPARRTMRVVHNTRMIHPLMPYDARHISRMAEFFTTAFGLQPAIPSSNQTWPLKELCTFLALAGALLFLVPCAALLLRVPVFRAVVHGLVGLVVFLLHYVFYGSR